MCRLEGQTIAVTGATGFIGKHLVNHLSQISDVRLILLSRSDPGELQGEVMWVPSSLEEMSTETWYAAGIEKLDVLIHVGGRIMHAGTSANNFEEYIQANIVGTSRLLESLPECISRIVFTSTIDVYANCDDVISEHTKVEPSSAYGLSKLFGEHLVRIYCELNGVCASILRLGHIYGPGEQKYEKLIPVVIRRVLSGKPPVLYGDGNDLRDFLYVDDAVEAIIRSTSVSTEILGPINIVSGSSVQVSEVVQKLARLCGYAGEIERQESTREGRSYRFDSSLMQEALGEWPLVSLEDGLSLEIEDFLAQLQ